MVFSEKRFLGKISLLILSLRCDYLPTLLSGSTVFRIAQSLGARGNERWSPKTLLLLSRYNISSMTSLLPTTIWSYVCRSSKNIIACQRYRITVCSGAPSHPARHVCLSENQSFYNKMYHHHKETCLFFQNITLAQVHSSTLCSTNL